MSLVDPSLEISDPCPDVYALFVDYNDRFFMGKLDACEVRWSSRMTKLTTRVNSIRIRGTRSRTSRRRRGPVTACAGICTYKPNTRECIVALSKPLLALRPRKDLVETLLHEMIHAFLFVTRVRENDGHGPIFQSHMRRINKVAGTNITIYHSFHDETKYYERHWWRCEGPCRNRRPFFGYVKRSMNRAPGPNDLWWSQHQLTCGGKFIKIKEPEPDEKRKNKKQKTIENGKVVSEKQPSPSKGQSQMDSWLAKGNTPVKRNSSISDSVMSSKPSNTLRDDIGGAGSQILGGNEAKGKKFDGKAHLENWLRRIEGKTEEVNVKLPSVSTSKSKACSKRVDTKATTPQKNSQIDSWLVRDKTPSPNKFSSITNGVKMNNRKRTSSSPELIASTSSWSPFSTDSDDVFIVPDHSVAPDLLVECPICQDFVEAGFLNDHLDTCVS